MTAKASTTGSTAERLIVTFDTNILIYAFDVDAGWRHQAAQDLLARASSDNCILTLQALSEFFHVVSRRKIVAMKDAVAAVEALFSAFPVVHAQSAALNEAMDMVSRHTWSFWDAMMFATARQAGCALLVSEDGQDGRHLDGLTIVNPFTGTPSPLLDEALAPA